MKICVLDGYTLAPGDISWDPIRELGDVTIYDRSASDEILERSRGCQALLTNKTPLDGETIRNLPGLKYIGVLATGYNLVDVETADKLGIIVSNIPAYSTDSVAQMAFALLLAATNNVESYTRLNREGKWTACEDFCYTVSPIMELAGKRMGIVGFGNIGQKVAQIALVFGMNVTAFTSKDASSLPQGVSKGDDAALGECDVVSLHCPLAEDTYHLVNREWLAKLKPGAILINTARGQLVDEEAVCEALRSGRLRALCTDVLSQEPPSPDNPVLKAPNVYVTPHIGWASLEARRRLMDIAAENLKAFVEGHPRNVVK
ncbi:MAG: D-2-hydroxyacid dehydrogenase [Muribaculaceae bacterium]|nr:D-2-hydroxyacid dehydrogenase [Muribaculaceae bacterium]MDE6753476.1 D-2-hydroxyacid dehydrogenase [Muribaculaceae bacterium]